MSSKTGGKTKKSEGFSHVVKWDIKIAYAFHLRGLEYMAEIDLKNWGFGKRAEEEIGFVSFKFGPFRVARMDRAKYDKFIEDSLLDVLTPLKDGLQDRVERMAPVSPTEVPPPGELN